MTRSSFVSNERDIRRISTCLCYSVKWRLVLVLGKLEQQRGSTISFHHSPLELPSKRNKKSVDKSSQHTVVNNEAVVFVSLSPWPVADIGPR